MKKGLLAVTTGCTGGVNIGDYIQALAAKQFLGEEDLFLERETELSSYNGEDVVMIMNGWYMNHPENFPPSDKIHPLWVALHINKNGLPDFLKEESLAYFKKYQPIGCRDTNSVRLLREKGIDAYFSGCLTLTLGQKYKSSKKSGKVFIVEPYSNCSLRSLRKIAIVKLITYAIAHQRDINTVMKKTKVHGWRNFLGTAYYLLQYSKVFDYSMLVDAEYVNQYNHDIEKKYKTHAELLGYAEELVKNYSEADCVITTRIHCALPCIGLETPVIFVEDQYADSQSTDRFGGLIELFNTITWTGKELKGNLTRTIINRDNFPVNKPDWKPIAQKLITTCNAFMQQKNL